MQRTTQDAFPVVFYPRSLAAGEQLDRWKTYSRLRASHLSPLNGPTTQNRWPRPTPSRGLCSQDRRPNLIIWENDRTTQQKAHGHRALLWWVAHARSWPDVASRGHRWRSILVRSVEYFHSRFPALKAASPVIANPRNRGRAVPLTLGQFRFAFANVVSESEAKELYESYAVPGSGVPLFSGGLCKYQSLDGSQSELSNSGSRFHCSSSTASATTRYLSAWRGAAYKLQKKNTGVTEFVTISNRGHSLVIDSGWREVADTALNFVSRFASTS